MGDYQNYFQGKTLTDVGRDMIQRMGLNVGYNGNDPNPANTNANTVLGGPVVPNMGVVGNLLAGIQSVHQDQPHMMGGQPSLGEGMAMPWAGKGQLPEGEIDQRINNKNLIYHATYENQLQSILNQGRIGLSSYEMDKDARPVSLSRTPSIEYTARRPITLALDPADLPRTKPIAEPGYGKSERSWDTSYMNPAFEFEERTDNQSIPIKAIRKILVDPALGGNMSVVNKAVAGKPIAVEQTNSTTRPLDRALTSDPTLKQRILDLTNDRQAQAAKITSKFWSDISSSKNKLATPGEGTPPLSWGSVDTSHSKMAAPSNPPPTPKLPSGDLNPDWISYQAEKHGSLVHKTVDGTVYLEETMTNATGKTQSKWVSTKGWKPTDMFRWLGY